MISLDYSVVYQIVIFLLLWIILSKLLFRPYLNLLDQRERRTTGAQHDSTDLEHEGARLRAQYEEKIAQAQAAGYAAKDSILQEARQQREKILGQAREEAANKLEQVRREEVVSTISQASAKKQAAEALVNEYRAKLAGLETEVQSILASLRQEGERERNRVVSEAQATAVKIKEDASFLAEQEVKMARQKLREEMAELAAATARQLVERNLSSADQTRLADDFIQTIGQTR